MFDFETTEDFFNMYTNITDSSGLNIEINRLEINGRGMEYVNEGHYQIPLSNIPQHLDTHSFNQDIATSTHNVKLWTNRGNVFYLHIQNDTLLAVFWQGR
jgi:hypothetical protein